MATIIYQINRNIKLGKHLGEGTEGIVFKISPRRVIKIYDGYNEKKGIKVAKQELRYSKFANKYFKKAKCFNYGLCVFEKEVRAFIIKEYIPIKLNFEKFKKYIKGKEKFLPDCHKDNYRLNSKKELVFIDRPYTRIK